MAASAFFTASATAVGSAAAAGVDAFAAVVPRLVLVPRRLRWGPALPTCSCQQLQSASIESMNIVSSLHSFSAFEHAKAEPIPA